MPEVHFFPPALLRDLLLLARPGTVTAVQKWSRLCSLPVLVSSEDVALVCCSSTDTGLVAFSYFCCCCCCLVNKNAAEIFSMQSFSSIDITLPASLIDHVPLQQDESGTTPVVATGNESSRNLEAHSSSSRSSYCMRPHENSQSATWERHEYSHLCVQCRDQTAAKQRSTSCWCKLCSFALGLVSLQNLDRTAATQCSSKLLQTTIL